MDVDGADVWALADDGTLLRRDDDGAWDVVDIDVGATSTGLFLRAAGEPWFIRDGSLARVDGSGVVDVVAGVTSACATDSGAVFALTASELLVSPDGVAPFVAELMPAFDFGTVAFTLASAVTCLGGDEVIARSDLGHLRKQFGRWGVLNTPPTSGIARVYAAAVDDVWAAAFLRRSASHYDGASWLTFDVLDGEVVRDVDGSSGDDVWFVGDHGRVAHFDGSTITRVDLPSDTTLISVDVFDVDDVWAVAQNGPLFHYDGDAWTSAAATVPRINGQQGQLTHAVMLSPQTGFALRAASGIATFDGTNWIAGNPALEPPDAARIDVVSADEMWPLTRDRRAWHFDGTAWGEVAAVADLSASVDGVVALTASQKGESAELARFDGSVFVPTATLDVRQRGALIVAVGGGARLVVTIPHKGNEPGFDDNVTLVESGGEPVVRPTMGRPIQGTVRDDALLVVDDAGRIFQRTGRVCSNSFSPSPGLRGNSVAAASVCGPRAALVVSDGFQRVGGDAYGPILGPSIAALSRCVDGDAWAAGDLSVVVRTRP